MTEEVKSAPSPQDEQKIPVDDVPQQVDDIDQFYCKDPNCKDKKKSRFSFPCPMCRDEIVCCGTCTSRAELRDILKIPADTRIARDRKYGYFDFPLSMPATGVKCAACGFVVGHDVDEPAAEVARRVVYAPDHAWPFVTSFLLFGVMSIVVMACAIVINNSSVLRFESVVLGNLYERGVLQIIGEDGNNLLFTDGYSLATGSVAHSDTRYFNDLVLVYPAKATCKITPTLWPNSELCEMSVPCAAKSNAPCRNATFFVYFSINQHFNIHPPRDEGPRLAYINNRLEEEVVHWKDIKQYLPEPQVPGIIRTIAMMGDTFMMSQFALFLSMSLAAFSVAWIMHKILSMIKLNHH